MNGAAGIDLAQSLADLRWLLTSAPLLDPAPGRFFAAVQQFSEAERGLIEAWLAKVESDPSTLLDFLQPGATGAAYSPRLGRRAERLLEFFLRHGPTHRLVAAHIALRDAAPGARQSTRGEIDFLLEDRAGQRWHWELAVKFYLCTARGATARVEEFIGPNRDDTLAVKLGKLFGQQLRHAPPAPWNHRAWMPAAFARGWLFYPRGQPRPSVDGLHPEHGAGTWLTWREAQEVPPGDWRWLPRERWLSAAGGPAALQLPTLHTTATGELARPAIAVRLERGVEAERVFVVPDGW